MPPKTKKAISLAVGRGAPAEKALEIIVEEPKMSSEAKPKKPRHKKERSEDQVKADKEKMAKLREMKKKK